MADSAALSKATTIPTIHAQKEELRKRIEHDPKLTKDFDFLIAKTGLQPIQLLTGLSLDCNLMKADQQTLLRQTRKELWPIDEDTLKRIVKNIRIKKNSQDDPEDPISSSFMYK